MPSRLAVKSHSPDFENLVANIGPFSPETDGLAISNDRVIDRPPHAANARNIIPRT